MSLANAIIAQDINAITSMLAHGVDVNAEDEYGFTPLIEAAIVNNTDIAALLLKQGADPNLPSATGGTALHWATENNNVELATLLLAHKANPNAYTTASESPLVKPILRFNAEMKQLLLKNGGSLTFAQDFMNTKLLGHRFELVGQVDIVNADEQFIEIDLEGFFLEFSIDVIRFSLTHYRQNYAAKHLRDYFYYVNQLTDMMNTTARLIHYQHYQADTATYAPDIQALCQQDPLIIPIAHRGHAIVLVRSGKYLARCDRRKMGDFADTITIYEMRHPDRLDHRLISQLVFKRNSAEFMTDTVNQLLGLVPVSRLMLRRQISGNCSWANVEAAIPTALFFLMHPERVPLPAVIDRNHQAVVLYRQWADWDKERALGFCLDNFKSATPARKASMAAIMGAILFQRCHVNFEKDRERAKKILKILKTPEYSYILDSYKKIYLQNKRSEVGRQFKALLEDANEPFA